MSKLQKLYGELLERKKVLENSQDNDSNIGRIKENNLTIVRVQQLLLEAMNSRIFGFKEENRWLSNFHPSPITHEDITYPTVEHYYVAMKSRPGDTVSTPNSIIGGFEETPIKIAISRIDTPGKAKRYGRKILVIRDDWDEIKLDVMRHGIELKFKIPELKDKLLNTGDLDIYEANTWGDTFWGVNMTDGKGQNHLGKIIMETRDKLTKNLL